LKKLGLLEVKETIFNSAASFLGIYYLAIILVNQSIKKPKYTKHKIQERMKNKFTKVLGLGIVLAAFSTGISAQATATATATATIITPIAITKDINMNFGNLAVQALTGGTAVLSPAGAITTTGGVTSPATQGAIAAASFTVTGDGNRTFSITLPASVVLTRNTGTETMTANAFTSNPTPTGTLASGTATLTVGATLTVAAAQMPGVYVSGTPFSVTVNYN
jgi:hypothetical protein